MMITLRGHSRKKDGRIHTDAKIKPISKYFDIGLIGC
jgi:hypothetical protein